MKPYNFFYIRPESFFISDLESCVKTESNAAINSFELANNKKLLNVLELVSMSEHYHNQKDTGLMFSSYISDFLQTINPQRCKQNKSILDENPVVRINFSDKELLKQFKTVMANEKHRKY